MRSWCFDSVATEVDGVTTYDREYGSAEFREVMRKLVGDGVYADPASNMQVTASGGLSVSVLPGYCWIKGALGIVDEAETLTLDATTRNRVDLIVARFDLSLAARDIHLAVVKGTEGSTVAPTLTRNDSVYEICLARVQVGATVTNITPANITDTRHDAAVCGIVAGIINQIDATDLFMQYGAVFAEFMAELENVLTGDVAGNLLTLINENGDKVNAHIANAGNPHGVTKSQVGLGNVLNEKQYCASNPPVKELWFNTLAPSGKVSVPVGADYGLVMAVFATEGLSDSSFGARQRANLVCGWGEKIYADYEVSGGGGTALSLEFKNFLADGRRVIAIENNESDNLIVRVVGFKL